MAYTEVVVVWSGALPGMPGYSKFRFIGEITGSTLTTAAANLKTFLNAFSNYVPSVLSLTIQPSASIHDDDGTLTSVVSIPSPPTPVSGFASGSVISAQGIMVRWITGAINGGHKVEGRTYIVPVGVVAAQADGTVVDSIRTTVQAAAITFAQSTPSPAVNSRANPAKPLRGNQTTAMLTAVVSDKMVVLRSRRD